MAVTFDEWVASLGGSVSADGKEFLRRVFDEHGPVSAEHAERIGREHHVALARVAVGLVGRDIATATDQEAPPFEYRDEAAGVWLAYWGQFVTTPLSALTQPAMTVEVADFIQDEVIADVHGAWPVCPTHNKGGYPRLVDRQPSWFCRFASHTIAAIGQLSR